MTNEVNDTSGNYDAGRSDDVALRVESAIEARINEINEENDRRLSLFKAEAEKYDSLCDEHLENRPSKQLLGDDSVLREWNEKRVELEGRRDVSRYQVKSMEKTLQSNKEAVIRQARHYVSQQLPDDYKQYQDNKVKLRVDALVNKFDAASNQLDNLIRENAPDKQLYSAALKVDRAVAFLEKSKGAESHISEDMKKLIESKKSVAAEIQAKSKSQGHELE